MVRKVLEGKSRGFTLLELLVVIAIIALLFGAILLIVNPFEVFKQGRDSTRVTDFKNLNQVISSAITTGEQQGVPRAQILCQGLTPPCSGSSIDANAGAVNGTGWVKINFAGLSVVQLPKLPVDPANNVQYHYTYYSDGNDWQISTVMESQKYAYLNSSSTGLYVNGTNSSLVDQTTYTDLGYPLPTASCQASPQSINTGSSVAYNATPGGGDGKNYSCTWSGDSYSVSVLGNQCQGQVTYNSPVSVALSVVVNSAGRQSSQSNCPQVSVTSPSTVSLSNVVFNPSSVDQGGTDSVSFSLADSVAITNKLIDIKWEDSSGNVVYQDDSNSGQSLNSTPKSFTSNWTTGASQTPGTYSVVVSVCNSSSNCPYYSGNIGSMTVTVPSISGTSNKEPSPPTNYASLCQNGTAGCTCSHPQSSSGTATLTCCVSPNGQSVSNNSVSWSCGVSDTDISNKTMYTAVMSQDVYLNKDGSIAAPGCKVLTFRGPSGIFACSDHYLVPGTYNGSATITNGSGTSYINSLGSVNITSP